MLRSGLVVTTQPRSRLKAFHRLSGIRGKDNDMRSKNREKGFRRMRKGLKKKDKTKPLADGYYIKLSVSIMLIAVLPVLIIGTLSYTNIKKSLVNEIRAWNNSVTDNAKNAFELSLNQMLYQASYLATSNITQEYESVFNSFSYENNSVSSLNEDLNGLNEYLYHKRNVIKMMSSIKNNNKYIDDIYFYDSEKNMILNTDGKQYKKENFYDTGWYDEQQNSKASFSRMDIRIVNLQGVNKNVVTLIYKSSSKRNAFIVNINISEMYDGIIWSLSALQGDSYIYSKDAGTLISGNRPVYKSVLAELGGPAQVIAWTEADKTINDRYLVSWVKSERLGWYFINVKDLTRYYANIEKSKNIVLVSSGLLIALLLVVSLLLFLRIYATLKKLIMDRFNMQNKLNANVPALQSLFKYDLIKGKFFSDEEVGHKLSELNLDIPDRDLVVLLVQYDGGSSGQIHEVFDKLVLSRSTDFCLDIDGQVCCVVHIPRGEMKLLDMRIQAAKHELRTESGVAIAVGVGRYCETRGELNRAFIEAFEALKYRFIYGSDEVIFFDDIKLPSEKIYNYPFEKEKALRNSIMTGNSEDAHQILKQIIDEMTESPNRISYTRLQQYFQMLVSGILKTSDMLGVDIDDVYGPNSNVLETIALSSGKEDFYYKCSQLLEAIMKYVSCENTKKNSKDINQLIAFMEQNYTRDISLIDVADVVGLNPSYVSRLIKNHTGKSFTDFIADKRMSMAEHLLLTTDLKLDDITRQVGYQNAYYFIKVFRKYYGTTPTKFRQAQAGKFEL